MKPFPPILFNFMQGDWLIVVKLKTIGMTAGVSLVRKLVSCLFQEVVCQQYMKSRRPARSQVSSRHSVWRLQSRPCRLRRKRPVTAHVVHSSQLPGMNTIHFPLYSFFLSVVNCGRFLNWQHQIFFFNQLIFLIGGSFVFGSINCSRDI